MIRPPEFKRTNYATFRPSSGRIVNLVPHKRETIWGNIRTTALLGFHHWSRLSWYKRGQIVLLWAFLAACCAPVAIFAIWIWRWM